MEAEVDHLSYMESAHKNLLMGVSQQQPQDRLPGQLTAQLNMVSDPVTGLRRRPGTEYIANLREIDLTGQLKPKVYHTVLGGIAVVIMAYGHNGDLQVFEERTGAKLYGHSGSGYILGASTAQLHFTTLGDDVFLVNTNVKPTLGPIPTGVNPRNCGYFYVVAGQYSKEYALTITNKYTGDVYTVSYTTPSGQGADDAKRASVHHIAWQLFGKLYGREAQTLPNGDPDISRPVVYAAPELGTMRAQTIAKGLESGYGAFQLSDQWDVSVSTSTGSGYLRTSNDMSIRSSDELPAILPTTAEYPATTGGVAFLDGVIVGTGTSANQTFLRWDAYKGRWIEDAAYGTARALQNMPQKLEFKDGKWAFGIAKWLPRPSGDEESNPDFNFMKIGITGMCAFQGRLVLLSNEFACLSASNSPLRWYKRSASALADDDPVEVAAQGTLTAPYVYGVAYNKDLVLFSQKYQAVIPGGGVLTPRSTVLSVTTQYEVDVAAAPLAAGRSTYFAAPRSLGYIGIQEMVPSPSTDSHYVADDITSHIPSYIHGPVAFMAGANTSGVVVVSSENSPPSELTAYQYIWAGNEKVQQAWHKWDMHKQLLGAYFTGDTLMVVLYHEGRIMLARLNLRALTGRAGLPAPRYDMQQRVTCNVAGFVRVKADYFTTITHAPRAYKVSAGVGQFLERSSLEIVHEGANVAIIIPEALPGDEYVVGHNFESLVEPSPPVVRDHNDVPITTTRATLRGYRVSYKDTGEFEYRIGDAVRPGQWIDTTPLRLYSRRLDAGQPFVDTAVVPLPARVDMLTSSLELRADGPYDMNISSLEYGYKHNLRYRRT